MKASTDISSPETSAASHSLPAYDLMGRRLLQPAAGQLYIVKGKKFFVKSVNTLHRVKRKAFSL